jgi:hypothetical protein
MQELDIKYNAAKIKFHLDMEEHYERMSNSLISQCDDLCKDKEDYHKRIQTDKGTLL